MGMFKWMDKKSDASRQWALDELNAAMEHINTNSVVEVFRDPYKFTNKEIPHNIKSDTALFNCVYHLMDFKPILKLKNIKHILVLERRKSSWLHYFDYLVSRVLWGVAETSWSREKEVINYLHRHSFNKIIKCYGDGFYILAATKNETN